jgi:hypothetical protein
MIGIEILLAYNNIFYQCYWLACVQTAQRRNDICPFCVWPEICHHTAPSSAAILRPHVYRLLRAGGERSLAKRAKEEEHESPCCYPYYSHQYKPLTAFYTLTLDRSYCEAPEILPLTYLYGRPRTVQGTSLRQTHRIRRYRTTHIPTEAISPNTSYHLGLFNS